jgi:hypothetical protein
MSGRRIVLGYRQRLFYEKKNLRFVDEAFALKQKNEGGHWLEKSVFILK